jgi:hypothetical protein
MRIQIKKKGNKTAILVSFDTRNEMFKSPSEKSKFFEELYGRNQTINRGKKKYFYRRDGLMDEIPNIKVDSSVFIVAMEQMKKMEEFMNEWEKKVMFKTFPVLLEENEMEQLEEPEVEKPNESGFSLLEAPKRKRSR